MWTWLTTELEYRKNLLIGILLFCLLAPPVLAGTMALLDVSQRALRMAYMGYVFMALVPIGVAGSTGYLREELRGLLLAPLAVKPVDIGTMRLGYTMLQMLMYCGTTLIASLLFAKLGVEIAWLGLLVFILFDTTWMAYSLVIEHFADYTRQAFLFMLLMLPMFIPITLLLSFYVIPNTDSAEPLFSYFASANWVYLFTGITLLFIAMLLVVARSGNNHRVVLMQHRYGVR